MQKRSYIIQVLYLLGFLAFVFGFRFVTQTGLSGDAERIQNDGYAMVGGVLLFISGAIFCYCVPRFPKRSSRKDIKADQKKNYDDLMEATKKIQTKKK